MEGGWRERGRKGGTKGGRKEGKEGGRGDVGRETGRERDGDVEGMRINWKKCTNLVSLINISFSFNEYLHYLKMSIKASCPQWTPTL